jgi:hypothetical protein
MIHPSPVRDRALLSVGSSRLEHMFEATGTDADAEDAWGIGLESQICAALGEPTPQSLRSVDFGGDDAVAAAIESGPGPWAAALLCTVEVGQLSPDGRLGYLRAWEQQASWAAAMAVPAIVEHVGPEALDDWPSTEHAYLDQAAAQAEVQLSLTLSPASCADRVTVARELSGRLSATLHAVKRGEVTYQQARVLTEITALLSLEDARSVEAVALTRCKDRPLSDWRRICRTAADRIDPEATLQRHRKVAAKRMVRRWRELDGMATLNVTAPAPDIEAIWGALTILAGPQDADDPRTIGARRVDALLGLCIGTVAPDPDAGTDPATGVKSRPLPPTQAHIVIDLPTLLGLADNPAELKGYGEVPAGIARDWLRESTTWRRLVTDPVEGHLLDYGPIVRFAPPRLGDYVKARDAQCIFPGCRESAQRSDLDHHPPWRSDGSGGHTSAANLAVTCRRHHRLKTHTGWSLQRLPEGGFEWTSPSGKRWLVPQRPVLGDD